MNQLASIVDIGRRPVAGQKPVLVLLHGWGANATIWRDFICLLDSDWDLETINLDELFSATDMASEASVEQLMTAMLNQIPEAAVLCGWSLGGVLASLFAKRFPLHVSGLITLACTPQFVANSRWPEGMDAAVFERFYASALASSEQALHRFWALQTQHSPAAQAERRWLRGMSAEKMLDSCQALTLLRDVSLLDIWGQLNLPVLHIYGEQDALVSAVAVERVASMFPGHEVLCFSDSAHMPFVSESLRCAQTIRYFQRRVFTQQKLHEADRRVEGGVAKCDVAASFSRAAASYDEAASLQFRVGNRLLGYACGYQSVDASAATRVLDIGAGTGRITQALSSMLGDAEIVSSDIAEGMLRYGLHHRHIDVAVCGDMENLPFAERAFDLCFSNMAMQWCSSPKAVLSSLYRVLKPGGQLCFSTLLPGTMRELARAWASVDTAVHVNQFASNQQWREAMSQLGFLVRYEEFCVELEYFADFSALANSLKQVGAHNVNTGRRLGLLGRQQYRALLAAYEQMRAPERGLPLSYVVAYWVLEKN